MTELHPTIAAVAKRIIERSREHRAARVSIRSIALRAGAPVAKPSPASTVRAG